MNAASGNSATAIPSLKKFVTESEIEEKRQKRQEEWEKVRQPNQPLEAPEEPVETRSLYEQLQAQKDLKQLEFDETHKLKNQVHGLDEEEAQFLDYVMERQVEVEKERHLEELEVLQEFRNTVSSRTAAVTPLEAPAVKTLEDGKQSTSKSTSAAAAGKKRTSQAQLLAGAVKRKRSESPDEPDVSNAAESADGKASTDPPQPAAAVEPAAGGGGVARVVGVLPGLGVYTDSEQSDSSSSDSEIDTDLFRRDQGKGSGGTAQKHR